MPFELKEVFIEGKAIEGNITSENTRNRDALVRVIKLINSKLVQLLLDHAF